MKKQTKDSFRGAGRVSFLARKDRIQKMIEEGYPLTRIYERHKADLNISYGQFTRYINQYVRSKPHDSEGKESKPREQINTEQPIEEPVIHDEEEPIFDEKKANEGDFF